MKKVFQSPGKYIQGKGELSKLGEYISVYSNKAVLIIDGFIFDNYEEQIRQSCKIENLNIKYERFTGECSKVEIDRIINASNDMKDIVIVGIGGGKTLDTAKAVAYYTQSPVIIVPTMASTDAPCSALSVIYTQKGEFSEYLFLKSNPDMVIMDTDIIKNAPSRFLASGMGDALATYFEARATANSNSNSIAGGKATKTAIALAKLCYETLLEDGYKAKQAVENHVCTKAVENIIEANTLLSGVGFESGGLAAAHAIHNGLTAIEQTHKYFHGEKVAFGTLVQLVLENESMEEINKVLEFCESVGLPITLSDIGISEIKEEEIMNVAKLSCDVNETIHNMPFEVDCEQVYAAILAADSLGKNFKIEKMNLDIKLQVPFIRKQDHYQY
ncbi:glycerol dehydrogenase [Romboutsia timonensis]|uniref:glycerol dehydrogenase n=1 Tax=Romboutsia timonensis TaxID=1776391 RepID=UPI0008DA8F7C|nr:glycerol dehydrogenase [Romboutsia timonensis]